MRGVDDDLVRVDVKRRCRLQSSNVGSVGKLGHLYIGGRRAVSVVSLRNGSEPRTYSEAADNAIESKHALINPVVEPDRRTDQQPDPHDMRAKGHSERRRTGRASRLLGEPQGTGRSELRIVSRNLFEVDVSCISLEAVFRVERNAPGSAVPRRVMRSWNVSTLSVVT